MCVCVFVFVFVGEREREREEAVRNQKPQILDQLECETSLSGIGYVLVWFNDL